MLVEALSRPVGSAVRDRAFDALLGALADTRDRGTRLTQGALLARPR